MTNILLVDKLLIFEHQRIIIEEKDCFLSLKKNRSRDLQIFTKSLWSSQNQITPSLQMCCIPIPKHAYFFIAHTDYSQSLHYLNVAFVK
mmetsp:Transcript_19751/g.28978  ORF Transcript_19751/g.28978 Transcript_19751/m.28978 type:complete len:89 (+) Transcript_19751:26-292(+)